ncbi:acyl-CoA dehydrogenase family protein [Paraburkholderia sp. IW21]|uniref:acyl-CoA dehydrogenase family protein n=1 Tax=Paraburkholderia sp. IW21 TaxID=3242488 RepID=UPI003522AA5C
MNSNLIETSAEHQQIYDSVAKITRAYGHAAFAKAGRRGEEARELWQNLAEAGYLGISVPEEYGGSGQGVEELAIVLEATAAQGCPMTSFVVLPIIVFVLSKHATEAQKREILPAIATGQKRLAFAITEPDAGTNTHNLKTNAVKTANGGWRLSGSKYYITEAEVADALLVVARTGVDEATGRGKLSLFLVPKHLKGVTLQNLPTELIVPERQASVFFDDVELPVDALIGAEGEGLRNVFTGLNPERIAVAALCNGLTTYALTKACEYAKVRKVWKTPIGAHQAVAHPLAEAYARLQLSKMATQRAAQLYDAGRDAGDASNIAKLTASDTAVFALDRAIQTHGGNGFSQEFGLGDLWFVARVQQTAPVSREMVLNHIAQHNLGLPRSY